MSEADKNATGATKRKGSFLRTIRAVAWAFFGLRKGSEYREDLGQINPLHLIVVGLLAFLLLVLGLMALVHWVT